MDAHRSGLGFDASILESLDPAVFAICLLIVPVGLLVAAILPEIAILAHVTKGNGPQLRTSSGSIPRTPIPALARLGLGDRPAPASHSERRRRIAAIEPLEGRVLLDANPISDSPARRSSVAQVSTQGAEGITLPDVADSPSFGGGSLPNASAAPIGLTPAQIRRAYGFDRIPWNGAGQTIAIVDSFAAPTIAADLIQFDSEFDLPNPPQFEIVGQTGGAPPVATDPQGLWELEQSLDVEWAHAIAPEANILLVEANDAELESLYAAVNFARNQPSVSVISMSFGGHFDTNGTFLAGEFASDPGNDSLFLTPAGHEGITFVAAAGDQGVPQYPATSPNVLSVGGTGLQNLDPQGDYPGTGANGEIAWSAGGGGPSLFETGRPAYQSGLIPENGSLGVASARLTPDVSFDAGAGVAVLDSYQSATAPWIYTKGSSVGAPQWAGLIALADQGRAAMGLGSLNGASQTLPMLYALPYTSFHDIMIGSNGHYAAGPGYDEATGLGTPIASLVVPGLMGRADAGATGSMTNYAGLPAQRDRSYAVATSIHVGAGPWGGTDRSIVIALGLALDYQGVIRIPAPRSPGLRMKIEAALASATAELVGGTDRKTGTNARRPEQFAGIPGQAMVDQKARELVDSIEARVDRAISLLVDEITRNPTSSGRSGD